MLVRNEKKRNNKTKKRKIIIGVLITLAVIICGALIWILNAWNSVYEPSAFESNVSASEKEESYDVVDGITNILLLGTDGRTLDEACRTDSMIIVTVDSNKQEIRLTSLGRDTLVNIPDHGQAKLNAAYAYGGASLLMNTIQDNFGISLDKYVTINFWGFENVIDTLGGLELEVTENEIKELNKYIGESTGGSTSPEITEPGFQVLNGQQSLSYARIRKNDSVYNRDTRQREVLFKLVYKLKDTNPIKYPALLNSMKDEVQTNLPADEIFNLAYTVYKFRDLDIKQTAMPLINTDTYETAFEGRLYKNLGWVMLTDLNQMSQLLRKFIYEGIEPQMNDVDKNELKLVLNDYKNDEQQYNAKHGINPEDHATDEDKSKGTITTLAGSQSNDSNNQNVTQTHEDNKNETTNTENNNGESSENDVEGNESGQDESQNENEETRQPDNEKAEDVKDPSEENGN